MSAEVLEGLVAFENLAEHEMYNGQSTGKYSVKQSSGSLPVSLRLGLSTQTIRHSKVEYHAAPRYGYYGRKAHHIQYTALAPTLIRSRY